MYRFKITNAQAAVISAAIISTTTLAKRWVKETAGEEGDFSIKSIFKHPDGEGSTSIESHIKRDKSLNDSDLRLRINKELALHHVKINSKGTYTIDEDSDVSGPGKSGPSSINSTILTNAKNISSANENIKKFSYLLKILKISDKIDNVDIETINAIFANISTISATFGW